MNEPIVYIIDDDAAVCDSLTLLLQTSHIRARAYHSASAFLVDYSPAMEGCIVLDIRMPGMNGLELQMELNRRGSILPIIFLSAFVDVPTTVRAVRNGALDVLAKPADPATLLENVRAGFELHARRDTKRSSVAEAQRKLALLTQREKEILELIINGESSKAVAGKLAISFRTVEVHRTHIMQKMGVDSLHALTVLADACGLPTGRIVTPPHTPRSRQSP